MSAFAAFGASAPSPPAGTAGPPGIPATHPGGSAGCCVAFSTTSMSGRPTVSHTSDGSNPALTSAAAACALVSSSYTAASWLTGDGSSKSNSTVWSPNRGSSLWFRVSRRRSSLGSSCHAPNVSSAVCALARLTSSTVPSIALCIRNASRISSRFASRRLPYSRSLFVWPLGIQVAPFSSTPTRPARAMPWCDSRQRIVISSKSRSVSFTLLTASPTWIMPPGSAPLMNRFR